MFSKSAQSPSIILAVHWDTAPSPSSATSSYSPSCTPFFSVLFLKNKEFYTSVCAWENRRQNWSALFSNNAPFRIKSEFPGFGFWSSDSVYSHITWKYNSPKQSGLFSFASHWSLDAIYLWWNLRTPPSTFAFECTRFIEVVGHHGETLEVKTTPQITVSLSFSNNTA